MKRSGPPARNTPLKRTRMKQRPVERDWADARKKVDGEGKCRACKRKGRVEAAHVIGRTHDKPREPGGPRWVDPLDVVALCKACHGAYDRRELDLAGVLTREEWKRAVALVGEGSALRRVTGRRATSG